MSAAAPVAAAPVAAAATAVVAAAAPVLYGLGPALPCPTGPALLLLPCLY